MSEKNIANGGGYSHLTLSLKQLSAFLKILEAGSFTKAAYTLNIAQSALSRQMKQLEDEMGVKLLNRLEGGVTATEAGLLLQERGTALLEQAHQLKDVIKAQAMLPTGNLGFGVPPSLYDLVTLPLVFEYTKLYSEVLLRVTEGLSVDLLQDVVSGRLDAAVVSRAEEIDGLEITNLIREPMYVVGSPEDRRKLASRITLPQLSKMPLIVTTRPNALRVMTDAAFRQRGLKGKTVFEANTSRIALGLAARGVGWAVLPYSAVQKPLLEGRIVGAPIVGLDVSWVLVYSRARIMSPATQALRRLLVDTTSGLIAAAKWPGARLDG